MVATATPDIAEPVPPAAVRAGIPRSAVRFTRHDVAAMVRAGIVPEDSSTELLNGLLVYVDRGATGEPKGPPMFPFTRHDVEAMVCLGIVPEDASTELLGGVLVHTDRSATGEDPMSIGQGHRVCVEKLSRLRSRIDAGARHVESQQPLVCPGGYTPQPDFMVLRGRLEDYVALPTAADALCVVEVADSSYELDSGDKLVAYARAGVPHYVIANLRNRTAEVYAGPDVAAGTYPPPTIVAADGVLSLRVGDDETFDVALADLLP